MGFASKKRPRIVFTAIVKNEAAVIRRCLESVKPYIDAWVISDTGSTDGTQDAIRETLAGIPGELLERPWVDFSTNRNEAIEAAAQFSPEYCLTLDADEELTTSAGFSLAGLTCDTYDSMFEMGGSRWPRKILFRPHLRYRYVLDETIDGGKTHDVLPACLVISRTDGARNADGLVKKYERDVEVLKRAVEREPNEPRYWFYLAQRLMGANRYDEAIAAFTRRIAFDSTGFGQERAYSQMMIGQCLEATGGSFEAIRDAYLAAWALDPARAEPLYALACVYSCRGEHALTELYARAAQRIPRPQTALPVDESVYAFRAADLLAGALGEQGRLTEALGLLEKLIALPQLPESEHERVRENIALTREAIGGDVETAPKLGPDEATYESQAARVRAGGLGTFRRMGLEYLNSFQAQSLPSPVRWLWIALCALFGTRAVSFVGAAAAVPVTLWALSLVPRHSVAAVALLTASPLLFLAARRRLQDGLVAALTMGAVGFAARGNAHGLGLVLFVLLGVKESAVIFLPALAAEWLLTGHSPGGFGLAAGAALVANAGVLFGLFGAMVPTILRAGARGHGTPYTLEHQRGAWHRLLVDLVLVSPVTTFAALLGPWQLVLVAAVIVAAHAVAPVRNVRLVIAADLLLRASAVMAFGWWALPVAALDLYISHRLRAVYDPVTAALASQLGMSR